MQVSEYELKATFLYNFTQFVRWPDHVFSHDTDPLVIGVLGQDPFGSDFDSLIRGERKGGHPLEVRRHLVLGNLEKCHLLFIVGLEPEEIKATLDQLKGQNVLTVSDIRGFSKMGGMIEMTLTNRRIRLKINQKQAEDAQLHISSKLLRLAEVVIAGDTNGQ